MVEKPEKLNTYLYALEKRAASTSFLELLKNWNISDEEYEEISDWFKAQGITGFITR